MTNQPEPTKKVPLDILQVYCFLQDFREDLTDMMMVAVDEWSAALRNDISSWMNNDEPEPNWERFRNWMNDICREDVMPLLFHESTPDTESEETHENNPPMAGFVAGKGDAYDYLPAWMQIPPLYHNEHNPNPLAIIKLFTPDSSWQWFLLESDRDDLLFCLVVGLETEFGYARLTELKSVKGPMGLHIERDIWFQPTPVRELPEYQERWGNKGPYPGEPEKSAPPSDTYNPPEPNIGGSLSLPDHDATPVNELPDGWTAADIHLLLKKLEKGPILVADYRLGIPTIHDNFGAETRHLGFGFMQVDGDGYTLRFDAGGAMQRTPSGNGWTKLIIEGQYQGYDINSVGQKLMSWLPSKFKRANNPLDQYSPVL